MDFRSRGMDLRVFSMTRKNANVASITEGVFHKRCAGAARWPAAARNWVLIDLFPAVETAGYYHSSGFAGLGLSRFQTLISPKENGGRQYT